MRQSDWLLAAGTPALQDPSAKSWELSPEGWVAIVAVLVLLAVAVVGAGARSRRVSTEARFVPQGSVFPLTETDPLPRIEEPALPSWLSHESMASLKASPVGPTTPAETRAYRLARLLVGELKEFCQEQVELGLRHKDLYARLQQDLDRSRETYLEMSPGVEKDFLQQELLHCVANGDPTAFG